MFAFFACCCAICIVMTSVLLWTLIVFALSAVDSALLEQSQVAILGCRTFAAGLYLAVCMPLLRWLLARCGLDGAAVTGARDRLGCAAGWAVAVLQQRGVYVPRVRRSLASSLTRCQSSS